MTRRIDNLVLSALLAFAIALAAAAPAVAAEGSGGVAAHPVAGEGSASSSHEAGPDSNAIAGASLATWYGPGLFGRHTACGQILTRHLVGVANRTLPCGTLVELSYNGRSLTAPVIDRGPYGRLHASFDLTESAAQRLKMTATERVVATIVGRQQNSPELGAATGQTEAASHASSRSGSSADQTTGGVPAS
jgi:rare lipoprotein A (peptidoglycan hydrolase)